MTRDIETADLMAPPLFILSLLKRIQERETLAARHRRPIIRGNGFHLRSMGSFPVARVTYHHAVLIEGMQITFLSFVSGDRAAAHTRPTS